LCHRQVARRIALENLIRRSVGDPCPH
jgi:hypothetical protein